MQRNQPASHQTPAVCNIQLPGGMARYWETTTMSETSTVKLCACVCPCDPFHPGSPMTLSLQHSLVKILSCSLTAAHSTTRTEKHAKSQSASLLHNVSWGEINTWL